MSKGNFYPMEERIWRAGYIIPWGLRVEYDDNENGFWVVHDPDYKNTVTDPRDTPKPLPTTKTEG